MNRTKSFDAIIFDLDGVLTDDRVWVDQDGLEVVSCSRRNGLGFDMFRKSSQVADLLADDCPDNVLAAKEVNNPSAGMHQASLHADNTANARLQIAGVLSRKWCGAAAHPKRKAPFDNSRLRD